ncbi:MAG: hypothetical protein V4564_12750, partial [Pseudomonadota bacterium]
MLIGIDNPGRFRSAHPMAGYGESQTSVPGGQVIAEDEMLRWEREQSLENAERAFSGEFCVGMIGPLSHAPGKWWYTLDGVVMNRLARCDGHVANAEEARAEVERGWTKWCKAAG